MDAEIAIDLGAIVRNAEALARSSRPRAWPRSSRPTPTVTAWSRSRARSRRTRPSVRLRARRGARAARRRHLPRRSTCMGPVAAGRSAGGAGRRRAAHAVGSRRATSTSSPRSRAAAANVPRCTRRSIPASCASGSTSHVASAALRATRTTPELRLAGAFTHLAAAEEIDSTLRTSSSRSSRRDARARAVGRAARRRDRGRDPVAGDAARRGALRDRALRDLAQRRERGADARARARLEPALSWRTRIVALHEIDAGTTVGYGRTWSAARRRASRRCRSGTPKGCRAAPATRAQALVRGTRVPVVGRICMDMAFST